MNDPDLDQLNKDMGELIRSRVPLGVKIVWWVMVVCVSTLMASSTFWLLVKLFTSLYP